jgi:hypothetical protein
LNKKYNGRCHLSEKNLDFINDLRKKYHKIDRPISYYLHHSIKTEKGFTIQHLMEVLKEYGKKQ